MKEQQLRKLKNATIREMVAFPIQWDRFTPDNLKAVRDCAKFKKHDNCWFSPEIKFISKYGCVVEYSFATTERFSVQWDGKTYIDNHNVLTGLSKGDTFILEIDRWEIDMDLLEEMTGRVFSVEQIEYDKLYLLEVVF